MFPDFMLLSEHVSEKIKIDLILKSADDLHRRHHILIFPIVILFFYFVQGMLFRKYIILPFHILNFLNLTNLQGVKLVRKLFVTYLEDFGEIAITQFLDRVKLLVSEGLGSSHVAEHDIGVPALELVFGPVCFLAFDGAIVNRVALRTSLQGCLRVVWADREGLLTHGARRDSGLA